MNSILLTDPATGFIQTLAIKIIRNAPRPSWLVVIPGEGNIFIYLLDGHWEIAPHLISDELAQVIGGLLISMP